MGSLFKPDPTTYASRVVDLMYEYSDRHGYIDYRASFDFNRAVTKILGQAEDAMEKEQWEVATAMLTGISSISEDILNSGDDSSGELEQLLTIALRNGMNSVMRRVFPKESNPKSLSLLLTGSMKKI